MTDKKLFLCVGLMVGTLCVPLAGHAATIDVTTTVDELNSDGDCSLREAIQAANTDVPVDNCGAGSGADTINVPAGTYLVTLGTGDDDNLTGDWDITSDVELLGAGVGLTILDGDGVDRALDVRCVPDPDPFTQCIGTNTVTVSGVTIQNGLGSGRGGGIRATGTAGPGATTPVLLLENCHVTNNSSGGGGVGVEAVVTIRNCLIDFNTASSAFSSGGGVDSFGVLTVEDSIIANNAAGASSWGGGIADNARLSMRRVLVTGNSAAEGAGVASANSIATLENVTISGNVATGANGGLGCGIFGGNPCNTSVSHCTIADNMSSSGGGLGVSAGTLTVKNTIVAGNAASAGPDVMGTVVSNGFNIVMDGAGSGGFGVTDQVGVDPSLSPLADNGGPSFTHAIDNTSAAFDAGDCTNNPGALVTEDQRGLARPQDVTCDIGAFEVGVLTPPCTPSPLLEVTAEAPGANCADGGVRIQDGVDADCSGTLEAGEATSTSHVCNGAEGNNALVVVNSEGPGANCTDGGQRIDVGVDDDGNGALAAGEIDATEYVCNGADGANGTNGNNSLVAVTAESPGANCVAGGQQIAVGVDDDGNATLEAGEVDATVFVCNGVDGSNGTGNNSLVEVTVEPAGANCSAGGQKIEAGVDENGDGMLDPEEVDATVFVCNGGAGVDGGDGSPALINVTGEPAGANCANGGTRIETGVDDDGSGALDAAEVDTTAYVCNGADGGSDVVVEGGGCAVGGPQTGTHLWWLLLGAMFALSRRRRNS